MPNWCNNNFSITGNTESIRDLWESAQKAKGLLQAIAPMPQELEGTTSPSEDGNDWYTWRVNNWGVKWDVDLEGLEFIDNEDGTAEIAGWFDSAWSPPIGAYEQLAADFDSCVISCSYHEPGMDFAGFWSSENGDEFFDGISEHLDNNEPDLWSPLARQLDEEYGIMESIEMWREEEDA